MVLNRNKYQCKERSLVGLKRFWYPKAAQMSIECDGNVGEGETKVNYARMVETALGKLLSGISPEGFDGSGFVLLPVPAESKGS